ncbi:MAG: pyrroline-5-carboxylate reductase [Kiritimatiellales bacterium]
MNSKIVFIGAGNMAEAIVSGIIAGQCCAPENIVMTDVIPERLAALAEKYGVEVSITNQAAENAGTVLLAVKPQVLPEILHELKPVLKKETLVISITAGITTRKIETLLGENRRVVRVMPNTPALIKRGASAIAGGVNAGESDLEMVEKIFSSVGFTVRVDEKELDAVTALSGSGPAYVFYLLEAMLAAAGRMGLDKEVARALALQTVTGSAELMQTSGEDADTLRANVTSKGGTTAAAINVLETQGVKEAIIEALLAAQKRSAELSAS